MEKKRVELFKSVEKLVEISDFDDIVRKYRECECWRSYTNWYLKKKIIFENLNFQ
jgi:hypothetical protein